MQAWACLSKADADRTYASNEGYPDALGSHYVYDSRVGNHLRIAVGDLVLIHDSAIVHGISRVDRIDTTPAIKAVSVCPNCQKTGYVGPRTTRVHAYLCRECRDEFDHPLTMDVPITRYSARYADQWQPFGVSVAFTNIEPALNKSKQSAIRRCDTGVLVPILDRFGIQIPEPPMDPQGQKREHSLDRIPVIPGDNNDGPDLLGVGRDARALAALAASKQLQPPLAIGLYGEWGSGKTFFMQLIEGYINRFTANDPEGRIFESGVRHIRFGAWHYAKDDLWASLLEHIFDSLHSADSKADRTIANVTESIAEIQDALDAAEEKVSAAKKLVTEADEEVQKADNCNKAALENLRLVQTRDVWSGIKEDADLRKQLEEAAATLHIPLAVNGVRELFEASQELISLTSRARFLATAGKPWYKSPLGAASLITAIGACLTLIIAAVQPNWLYTIGSVIPTCLTASAALAAWLRRQATLARQILVPAERLQRQIERRVEEQKDLHAVEMRQLKAQADKAQADLDVARERRDTVAQDLKAEIAKREELTPGKLLHDYIAERAQSGDYASRLGSVGTAHRELRELSDLLRSAATEPAHSLRRIVLYIDDLDRCPSAVLPVLEAVHLLLALPLFVVVVSVDRRILDQSLRLSHPEILTLDGPITASNYLEKIFQLTYTLPPMDDSGCEALLLEAIGGSRSEPAAAVTEVSSGFSGEIGIVDQPEEFDEADDELYLEERLAGSLMMTEEDRNMLKLVAPLLTAGPRRAKRFLAAYSVVRARFSSEPENAAALAVLVAVLVGAPRTLGQMLRRCDQPSVVSETFGLWATEARQALADGAETLRVDTFLKSANTLLNVPMGIILNHLPLAERFT